MKSQAGGKCTKLCKGSVKLKWIEYSRPDLNIKIEPIQPVGIPQNYLNDNGYLQTQKVRLVIVCQFIPIKAIFFLVASLLQISPAGSPPRLRGGEGVGSMTQ